jgi:hypothetical protein
MLRRFLHIILVLLVLLVTSGVTVTRHFCGNNLRSVEIMTTPQSCCDMEGCCHNETVTIVLEDDFTPVWADALSHFSFTEIFPAEIADVSASGLLESIPLPKFIIKPPPVPLGDRLASLQVYIL